MAQSQIWLTWEGTVPNREALEGFRDDLHPKARLAWDGNRRIGIEGEARLGDVLTVIPIRGRDIAGESEARQRGERQIRRPSNPRLQHPSAPHGYPAFSAEVVDRATFLRGPPPAGLDFDDPAGADLYGLPRVPAREDALVEADGRAQPCLEPAVVDQVVLRQGLLDQQKIKIIHGLEHLRQVESVGRVGVHLEGQLRESS